MWKIGPGFTSRVAICVVCSFLSVNEAGAASTTANSTATVLPPVTITKVTGADLSFGTIAVTTSQAVTITPPATPTAAANTGTRAAATAAGIYLQGHTGATNVAAACSAAIGCGAAVFNITGGNNATVSTFTITPPTTLISGANSIPFSLVTRVPSGNLTLSATGTGILAIGGTITPAASQAAGSYTATMTVVADY